MTRQTGAPNEILSTGPRVRRDATVASIHNFIVVGLSHGAAWRLFVQRRDEQFNCSLLHVKHPPPPARLIAPESPQCFQHWRFTLADSVGHYDAVSSGCMGSKQLWANSAPQILSMWHWLLGQYRPSSPYGWRDDPVDHSAMSSRLATRICLDMSSLRTRPITTWQPSSARVDVMQPTPARRHLSWSLADYSYLFTYIGPQTSDNHVAYVHGGWYNVGRGLAVRCSCVLDPYIMMCIVGWAGSSLVLVLFLSTVSSRHPEGEVGRYCPKRQCHMHILEGQRLLTDAWSPSIHWLRQSSLPFP